MNSNTDRRRILGASAIAAGVSVMAAARVSAQDAPATKWQAAREPQDAWLDVPNTRHRLIFDTVAADAVGGALKYGGNFIGVNMAAYGLKREDLSTIIVLRHMSTPFGYNDSVWAEYGEQFVKFAQLEGDTAKAALKGNPLLATSGEGKGSPLGDFVAQGGTYAVCGAATHFAAQMLAKELGKDADALEKQFIANLIPGARIVPAGIVTVNRAQEYGYAFSYVG